MEWIPYSRLLVKRQIAEGGFGIVYLANWLDGAIYNWNINYQQWNRNTYQLVALKILKNSSNLPFNLLKEEVSFCLFVLFLLYNYLNILIIILFRLNHLFKWLTIIFCSMFRVFSRFKNIQLYNSNGIC